jgi:succinoglycan biosynthesis transport protein ExoP
VTLLEAIRRGWRLLLVAAIPMTAGVAVYTESLANQYSATAVVSFSPRPNSNVGADVISLVVPKYQVYVTSDAVVADAARSIGVSKAAISSHLNASIPQNTSNLDISVDGTTPSLVANAANSLAKATERLSHSDQLLLGTVVAQAEVPTSPSGPNRRLLEVAGGIMALLVGVGVVLLVDRVRPVVRTATDVGKATELRVIGMLPRTSAVRGRTEALTNRRVGPAVRNLRTQLDRGALQHRDARRGAVLVITSAQPGEGKTTVASLLAMASARVDQRVLLIDGDLVRPNLSQFFGLAPRPGVAQALQSETIDERAFARENVLPRLSVMPTTPDPDAGDLIARNMERLLDWAANRFDLVIVDAPPVLGNDSGQKIATLGDGVLLVVGRSLRVGIADEAAATLRSLDARVLGAVANGFPSTESAGY